MIRHAFALCVLALAAFGCAHSIQTVRGPASLRGTWTRESCTESMVRADKWITVVKERKSDADELETEVWNWDGIFMKCKIAGVRLTTQESARFERHCQYRINRDAEAIDRGQALIDSQGGPTWDKDTAEYNFQANLDLCRTYLSPEFTPKSPRPDTID